jgi:hypothetical protein
MNATLRNMLLAVLPVATFAPGCLHHHADPIHGRASGLRDCEPGPGETSCVESSRLDDRGILRHHVVERVTPGDRCDLIVVEQASFDARGVLVEQVTEQRRCGVVDQRVAERFDLVAGVVERHIQRDDDHDDIFDLERRWEVAMTEPLRSLALSTGLARLARLRGRPGVVALPDAVRVASTGP